MDSRRSRAEPEVARRSRINPWPSTSHGLFRVLCATFVVSVCQVEAAPPAPAAQTVAQADAKSIGCMSCHTATDRHTMHQNPGVVLGCTDCHGGGRPTRGRGTEARAAAQFPPHR